MTTYNDDYLTSPKKSFNVNEYAAHHGITVQAAWSKRKRAKARATVDPAITRAMSAIGTNMVPSVVWDKTQPGYSVLLRPSVADAESLTDILLKGLSEYKPPIHAPRVNNGDKGNHLLVVDLADVHFGKLCSVQETGSDYTIEEARHRVIEGTKALLSASKGIGVQRILFVMGNDILNTDNGKTTTSGTPQDTDKSFFQSFRAAQYASIDAINECANLADVDLLHCMSNHDFRSGWQLSQTVAAHFGSHSNVRATDYNMSENHRKYYGFERNALMFSHGDGTKEEKIIGHFMQEAKPLVASCDHFYAILHHMHHKMAKRRGVDVFQGEKDHNGMTAIVSGSPRVEGSGIGIEYVRSPSPPDGWHHRNGYMNRQGVECFAYHAYDGQRFRFTEWF